MKFARKNHKGFRPHLNKTPKKRTSKDVRFYLVPVMGVDKLLLRKILMLCSALGRFKIYSHKKTKISASFTLANLSG